MASKNLHSGKEAEKIALKIQNEMKQSAELKVKSGYIPNASGDDHSGVQQLIIIDL